MRPEYKTNSKPSELPIHHNRAVLSYMVCRILSLTNKKDQPEKDETQQSDVAKNELQKFLQAIRDSLKKPSSPPPEQEQD
jgi:hypothetical protein